MFLEHCRNSNMVVVFYEVPQITVLTLKTTPKEIDNGSGCQHSSRFPHGSSASKASTNVLKLRSAFNVDNEMMN